MNPGLHLTELTIIALAGYAGVLYLLRFMILAARSS